MRLLYNSQDGKIFYAVYDRDWFGFAHNTFLPLSELYIGEVDPANKAICLDLARTVDRVDAQGNGKYYINAQGQLMERGGWVEWAPEVL